MFGLVECLRNFPSQHSVNCADNDEEDRIRKRYHIGSVYVGGTDQQVVLSRGVVMDGSSRRYNHPHPVYQHLEARRLISKLCGCLHERFCVGDKLSGTKNKIKYRMHGRTVRNYSNKSVFFCLIRLQSSEI